MVDYSKFANIVDSDDEAPAKMTRNPAVPSNGGADAAAKATRAHCALCSQACEKPLLCGKCKTKVYCSAACQKSDWQYHRRFCTASKPMHDVLQSKFPGMQCFGGESMLPTQRMVKSEPPSEAVVANNEEGKAGTEAKAPPMAQHAGYSKEKVAKAAIAAESQTPDAEPRNEAKDNVHSKSGVRCCNCLQGCAKPLKCSRCKEATYCCERCQREDWKDHKRICKEFKSRVICPHCQRVFKDNEAFCNGCGARRPNLDTVRGPSMHTREPDADGGPDEEESSVQQAALAETAAALAETVTASALVQGAACVADAAICEEVESFDEQDMMPWWMRKLAALQLSESQSDISVQVSPITSISGKASIDRTGAAARYSFDITFSVEFDMEKEETTSSGLKMFTSSTGSVHVKKCSHDTRSDIEVELNGTDVALPVAQDFVIPRLKSGLKECIAAYESLGDTS